MCYSSLSNLRVKIDGSFIKSVESGGQAAAIVRLVLGLGRGLNLPVLAEGVETSAELAFLESEFCNEAQGYLLGKPADIESYRRLRRNPPQGQSEIYVMPSNHRLHRNLSATV
jgi:EAL domain-containing protein (putative c-di-GMP-specific phosphodiesterase class I)